MTRWVLPCDVTKYKLDKVLTDLGRVDWTQSRPLTNIAAGDEAFIYECAPLKMIGWKCRVVAANKMYGSIDDRAYSISGEQYDGPFVELEVIRRFDLRHLLTLPQLQTHGIKGTIRSPYPIKQELSDYLDHVESLEDDPGHQLQDAASLSIAELERIAARHSGAKPKLRTSSVTQIERNPYVSELAKRKANGVCQLCGKSAPFTDPQGKPYLESHHIVWLSKGGTDSIANVVALCPNCHRRIHVLDDPADTDKLIDSLKAMAGEACSR